MDYACEPDLPDETAHLRRNEGRDAIRPFFPSRTLIGLQQGLQRGSAGWKLFGMPSVYGNLKKRDSVLGWIRHAFASWVTDACSSILLALRLHSTNMYDTSTSTVRLSGRGKK